MAGGLTGLGFNPRAAVHVVGIRPPPPPQTIARPLRAVRRAEAPSTVSVRLKAAQNLLVLDVGAFLGVRRVPGVFSPPFRTPHPRLFVVMHQPPSVNCQPPPAMH